MLLDCVWLVGKPGHDAEAFFITDISRNTGMAVKCIVQSDQSAQLACPLQVSSLLDIAGNVWETSLGQGKKIGVKVPVRKIPVVWKPTQDNSLLCSPVGNRPFRYVQPVFSMSVSIRAAPSPSAVPIADVPGPSQQPDSVEQQLDKLAADAAFDGDGVGQQFLQNDMDSSAAQMLSEEVEGQFNLEAEIEKSLEGEFAEQNDAARLARAVAGGAFDLQESDLAGNARELVEETFMTAEEAWLEAALNDSKVMGNFDLHLDASKECLQTMNLWREHAVLGVKCLQQAQAGQHIDVGVGKNLSLVLLADELLEAASRPVVLVHWQAVDARLGRVVNVGSDHRVKAICNVHSPRLDFSSCSVVLPSCDVVMKLAKGDDCPKVPQHVLHLQTSWEIAHSASCLGRATCAEACVMCRECDESEEVPDCKEDMLALNLLFTCALCHLAWHPQCSKNFLRLLRCSDSSGVSVEGATSVTLPNVFKNGDERPAAYVLRLAECVFPVE